MKQAKILAILILMSNSISFAQVSNEYSVHKAIFKYIAHAKIVPMQDNYIHLTDRYYLTKGGGISVAPSGEAPIYIVDTQSEIEALSEIRRFIEVDSLYQVCIIDTFPCHKCPPFIFAKSLLLEKAKEPSKAIFIDIGLPIEGWNSLSVLSKLIYLDSKYEYITLSIPVTTVKLESIETELFVFNLKKTSNEFSYEAVKRISIWQKND